MNKICIKTENLNLHYSMLHALKDVNIEIREKEITALIGPSGCGKSTLLKCFNRMNDLIENCIIDGKIYMYEIPEIKQDIKNGEAQRIDIYSKIDINKLRKNVGMVFQKPNVFPMSIYDNVAFGPRTHGIKKRNILDSLVAGSLKRANLWEEVKDRLHKSGLALSGGQQQRLCIARALAVEPKILLMDEPTSALDPISTAKVEELCEELKESVTIVIVTHNMQQAARISDKTAFFLLGDLIEFNDTREMFASPKEEQTMNYISGRFG